MSPSPFPKRLHVSHNLSQLAESCTLAILSSLQLRIEMSLEKFWWCIFSCLVLMLVQGSRRIRNLSKAYIGAVVKAVEKGNGPFSLRHLFAALRSQSSPPMVAVPGCTHPNPELLEVLYKKVSCHIILPVERISFISKPMHCIFPLVRYKYAAAKLNCSSCSSRKRQLVGSCCGEIVWNSKPEI